jgi:diaminopimelate epimerase
MQVSFTKMHALGNDFMVLRGGEPPGAKVIRALSDRRTGVGFDQLLWVEDPRDADTDAFYRTFNADGSEAEQCGNGVRCIARHVAGKDFVGEKNLRLGFSGGIVDARIEADGNVSVLLGEPDFDPGRLPFDDRHVLSRTDHRYCLEAAKTRVEVELVSMGNPHAVITVESVDRVPVGTLGPALERHACFPKRANISFMQIDSPERIRLRVFERGAGETRACGTAACAAVAIGRRAGKLAAAVNVELPGGTLRVSWPGPGEPLRLSGEAVTAFEGTVAI